MRILLSVLVLAAVLYAILMVGGEQLSTPIGCNPKRWWRTQPEYCPIKVRDLLEFERRIKADITLHEWEKERKP